MLQTLSAQQCSIEITNHKVEQRRAGIEGSDTEDSSTPTLRINLLGTFQLDLDNTPTAGIDLPRLRSLLAYLALHRWTPLSRSYLASLFWPDSTDAQAHTNLRNLIHIVARSI